MIGIYFLTIKYLKKIERSAYDLLNDDPMAILAMEIARTDNYGEYDSYDGETVCPVWVLLNRNITISMMMKNVSLQ